MPTSRRETNAAARNLRVVGGKQPQPGPGELPPPHSPEAEEAVLGSLLADRETITTVAPHLKPEYFFSEERASVYQAMLNLYADRVPADIVTVRSQLKTMDKLGEGEGQVKPAYLAGLMRAGHVPVHVGYYMDIVIKHWLGRQLIAECSATIAEAYQQTAPAGELMAGLTSQFQGLAASLVSGNPAYVLSHEQTLDYPFQFDKGLDGAEADPWGGGGKLLAPLRFGWDVFDGNDYLDPPSLCLLPATLTTILARTGGGKTIAAMQIADANAMAGLNVLYFHVELNQQQMLARRYTRLTGVPVLPQITRRNLSDGDKAAILRAANTISQWPGRVDFIHCPNWPAERLAQEIKARHYAMITATRGRGYDLIILDYLQRLGRPEHLARAPEHEALAANVRTFSDTLNELNIAGLMTSQVGRNEAQQFEPPELSEGLGSGDIERCSNQLLALAISQDKQSCGWAIRKNTFGEQGKTGSFGYDPRRLQFVC